MSLKKTQSFTFSELNSNQPKSEIYLKMLIFEQLKKTSSSELKKKDPSLERSWYDLFRIIKAHGPKNQPRDVIVAPYYVFSKDAILGECSVYFFRGPW